MVAELLTGEEQLVYRDSGYLGAEKRTEAVTRNKYSKRIHYKICLLYTSDAADE